MGTTTKSAKTRAFQVKAEEQKIRWERNPSGSLVIRDSSTGKVLKVVRSLFELFRRN
ncbi:MAG TPA: hypothetical protein PK954_18265 [Anaerolineales bacterium]|nr:hypothetical protein [Anaerolineales bacterium]HRF49903.1 hypothetical protein [Anaerolineales bacterium]